MQYEIHIGWLYPELMSTYGDRGNIICLTKRSEWRNINVNVIRISDKTSRKELATIDILFGGGAQDKEQEIVMRDLHKEKGKILKGKIEADMPALFVCGAPQLMGKYYEPAIGERIEGLGIFDIVTVNKGPDTPRCIGNIVAEVIWENLKTKNDKKTIVGFENHGGRTYLGENAQPFAKVIKGFGNNGEDGTEGVVYKNAIGCYSHGPLLPKNPHIADFLIKRTLSIKYQKEIFLSPLDDTLEWKAHNAIAKQLNIAL